MGGIPIHASDALEEHAEVEAIPLESQVGTVLVAGFGVTDNASVAGVVYGVFTGRDNIVTIQICETQVTGMKSF